MGNAPVPVTASPTASPTEFNSPTASPSVSASSRPSASATESPSVTPSASLTSAPTTSQSCEDGTENFTLESNNRNRPCSWVLRNNASTAQINRRCALPLLGGSTVVSDHCPATCGTCPIEITTATPSSSPSVSPTTAPTS